MAWSLCESRLKAKYRRHTHTITCAVEERYLRDDVSCGLGYPSCQHCPPLSLTSASLDLHATSLVIPDADALDSFLEVWELPDITNWLILTSVLQKMSTFSSTRKLARVRALYKDRRRHCYLFDDLHCIFTQGSASTDQNRLFRYLPHSLQALLLEHSQHGTSSIHDNDTHLRADDQLSGPSRGVNFKHKGWKGLMQQLVVAEYYSQHLDGRIPIVVITSLMSNPKQDLLVKGPLKDAEGKIPHPLSQEPLCCMDQEVDEVTQMLELLGVGAETAQASLPEAPLERQEPFSNSDTCSNNGSWWPPKTGVHIVSPQAYFSPEVWGHHSPAVCELTESILQAKAASQEKQGGSFRYPAHWSPQDVEEGLSDGSLFQGKLHVSPRNPCEGLVHIKGSSASDASSAGVWVRLAGRQAMNRSMEGDWVAVQVLPSVVIAEGSKEGPEQQLGSSDFPIDAAMGIMDEVQEDVAPNISTDQGVTAEAAQVLGFSSVSVAVEGGSNEASGNNELGGEGEGEGAAVEPGPVEVSMLPLGKVVAVLHNSSSDIVACVSQKDEVAIQAAGIVTLGAQGEGKQVIVMCIPYDGKLPFIRVRTRQAGRLLGQRLVLRVDGWDASSMYPSGHVVRILGKMGDLRAEGDAVLVQCGIRWQPFCEGALKELPQVADASQWRPSAEETASRRDLSGPEYFVCSIDPPGCTDVDDALHVRRLPGSTASTTSGTASAASRSSKGLLEVGVHIADVSFFVRPGSMLDGEARDRCTSVYLVDRRLDMLPALLSEQLCSLRSGAQRYAVSVLWTIREDTLEVVDVWMGRTIIASRHQLTYQQAQDVLEGRPPAEGDELSQQDTVKLKDSLQVLTAVTDKLRAKRLRDGALDLSGTELRFQLDGEGNPATLESKVKVPMMDLIAEMMIWANAAVAERIATAFPGSALLRNHPPPRQVAFEQVQQLLLPSDEEGGAEGRTNNDGTSLGPDSAPTLDPRSNKAVSSALSKACARTRDPAAAQLIRSMLTRAMSEAKYLSTGSNAPPGSPATYHYGLALPFYTHFTSPIRRYADVVVHRQLLAAIEMDQKQQFLLAADSSQALFTSVISHSELSQAAERMNEQHRRAKAAQKQCTELYMLELLHRTPHVEKALVIGVKGTYVEVFIPKYQLTGKIKLLDTKGLVKLPLISEEDVVDSSDAFADAARRRLSIMNPTADSVQILEDISGERMGSQITAETSSSSSSLLRQGTKEKSNHRIVWSAATWQHVWVRLAAASNRAHGPRLGIQLVSEAHPLVQLMQQKEDTASLKFAEVEPEGLKESTRAAALSRGNTRVSQAVAASTAIIPECSRIAHPAVGSSVGIAQSPEQQELLRDQPAEESSEYLSAVGSGHLANDVLPDDDKDPQRTATYEPLPLRVVGDPWDTALASSTYQTSNISRPLLAYRIVQRDLEVRLASCVSRLERASLNSKARELLQVKRETLEEKLQCLQKRLMCLSEVLNST
ncbi:hypothetical protein CEUSTIGMA_g8764.t1 [Chlamydomonas eustigma]|uniref:DIS3-like exonuclease 1 n=1 Tax=Chlamydomonas eustigma TaxID=1157962 RepID=A0A250XE28_9CHLO|nr:hypothetical protein CEUSTIGMA_g8764.t1 [Chlamydomonas eustigma]|eukprot:GAX81333.1 hypothetical protein CEUSTIGMA_g8764.t1 [Chlamydomonas eustigma]